MPLSHVSAGCQYESSTTSEDLCVDNQQALKLLHRYHDATNAGRLDELDDLFAQEFTNFAAGFEPVKEASLQPVTEVMK